MLTITGIIKKKYQRVATHKGFFGSDIHRFVLKVDTNYIGSEGLYNLYHESVFQEIMFHFENFSNSTESIMDQVNEGDHVNVKFSIGNFNRKKQPNRKDKNNYILWVFDVEKIK